MATASIEPWGLKISGDTLHSDGRILAATSNHKVELIPSGKQIIITVE